MVFPEQSHSALTILGRVALSVFIPLAWGVLVEIVLHLLHRRQRGGA